MKRDPILLMYNALFAIGALDDTLHTHAWCHNRAREIASAAIREMNVEHTELVQKALKIGAQKKS